MTLIVILFFAYHEFCIDISEKTLYNIVCNNVRIGFAFFMKRTESREAALSLIFERFARAGEDADEIFSESLSVRGEKVSEYARRLYFGVCENVSFLDTKIGSASRGWSVSRMSQITAAILRLFAYELYFDGDMPIRVVINEAVEITKRYDDDGAPAFVNGILGKLSDDAETFRRKSANIEPDGVGSVAD